MFGVGVENPEARPCGHGHGGEARAGAVDEDEAAGLAKAGDALVEDAAGDADEVVLGVFADFDDGLAVGVLAGGAEEGEGGGELDGGAGGKAGARGEVALGEVVEAGGGGEAEVGQGGEDAEWVVGPGGGVGLALGGGGGERDGFARVAAVETALAVVAQGEGHGDAAVDGGAEDGAAVVVGVVADELDAAGGAGDDLRGAAEDGLELVGEGGFVHGGRGKGGGKRWRWAGGGKSSRAAKWVASAF